jgi:hypothetical protein
VERTQREVPILQAGDVEFLAGHLLASSYHQKPFRKMRSSLTRRADRQIDVLVYELYGLIDEEIKIVEGNQALQAYERGQQCCRQVCH